jgi:hypothetical protein
MNTFNSVERRSRLSAVEIVAEVYRRQPIFANVAALMLALMVVSFAGLLVDTRTFNGINVWIKPLKFESSIAIYVVTLAWFWPYLDQSQRSSRAVRLAVWWISAIFLLEMSYILFRAARAEGSHFNNSTVIAEVAYAIMGIGILSIVAFTAWLGWLFIRANSSGTSPILRFAIGIGLIAGAVLGGLTGMHMSAQPGHWVGGVANDVNGLPLFGWSRTGGDLRVAHFVGLHAMQGIPVVGWLASHALGEKAKPIVWVALVLWAAVTLSVFVQATAGRALFPL